MYFQDAIGDTTSIVLGYDVNASDTIDAAFGEANIDTAALDSGIDVRIGNTDYQGNPNTSGSYQTKKQITYNYCGTGNSFYNYIQSINIYTQHWPVTATWNSSLFNDTCRYGSIFTSFIPGGWFDVNGNSNLGKVIMYSGNSVTFTRNYQAGYITNGDTVSNFWFVFADSSLLTLGIQDNTLESQTLKIYPNPSSQTFNIINTAGFKQMPQITNIMGQKIAVKFQRVSTTELKVNMENYPKGIYLIKIGTRIKRLALE